MKAVKVLIWLGFIALLVVSIPKIAWVFRYYEGNGVLLVTLGSFHVDILWIIPLFVALCIDALTLALTYAVKVDKARASQFSMWAFVGLLCGLSYYCNLLYNAPTIWATPLVRIVTPFILSGVPLFALCYTLILSRIEGQGETLAEKAARLESERTLKDRIRKANKGRFKGAILAGIADGKEVFNELVSPGAVNGEPSEESAGKIVPIHQEDRATNDEPNTEESPGKNEPGNVKTVGSPGSTSGKTLTIKEASAQLGLSESYVRDLRNNGTLRRSPRNRNLLLKSSVTQYENMRHNGHKTEPVTGELQIVNADLQR